jgi:hypothetical protein
MQCPNADCSWRAIAPSTDAAREQYARHVLEEHAREVDADIPEGKVQVKLHPDGEWFTTTRAVAKRLHDDVHGD